jgi:hypothetical protein
MERYSSRLDEEGELVGINTAIFSTGGGNVGIAGRQPRLTSGTSRDPKRRHCRRC